MIEKTNKIRKKNCKIKNVIDLVFLFKENNLEYGTEELFEV